ncbi:hypothetical protein F2P79_010783 [Pimephales promelas]|nr:hypothetical protein F2P79_010783 [Pimephales promelas]
MTSQQILIVLTAAEKRAPILWYCILRLNVNPRCCWKLREQVGELSDGTSGVISTSLTTSF